MFEKRKVTITLLDLFCLFIGRVVIWFTLTLLAAMVIKGLFNLIILFLSVLKNIWPILLFMTIIFGMILFLMKDDKKSNKKVKKVEENSILRTNNDLVFINLNEL